MTESQWIVYFVLELTSKRPDMDHRLALALGRSCVQQGPPEIAARNYVGPAVERDPPARARSAQTAVA